MSVLYHRGMAKIASKIPNTASMICDIVKWMKENVESRVQGIGGGAGIVPCFVASLLRYAKN